MVNCASTIDNDCGSSTMNNDCGSFTVDNDCGNKLHAQCCPKPRSESHIFCWTTTYIKVTPCALIGGRFLISTLHPQSIPQMSSTFILVAMLFAFCFAYKSLMLQVNHTKDLQGACYLSWLSCGALVVNLKPHRSQGHKIVDLRCMSGWLQDPQWEGFPWCGNPLAVSLHITSPPCIHAKTESRSFPPKGGWYVPVIQNGQVVGEAPWKEPQLWRTFPSNIKVDEWGYPVGWQARLVSYWTSVSAK